MLLSLLPLLVVLLVLLVVTAVVPLLLPSPPLPPPLPLLPPSMACGRTQCGRGVPGGVVGRLDRWKRG